MFVQIDGTRRVKPNSLLATYIRELGVKSWCALFIASMGVLGVFLAWLCVMIYGTLIMNGTYYHFEEPFFLMAPSVIVAAASWLIGGGALIFWSCKKIAAWSLQFWGWSQNSCSPIEFDYKSKD